MGRGRDVFMGALVSKEHMEKVRRYINYAIEDDGKILCGETINVPLLEDEAGPDKEGKMSEGNLHFNSIISNNNIKHIIVYKGIYIHQKLTYNLIWTGYFVPPTVITGLKDSSRCMQEEIFGPVVCITKFSGDDEGSDTFYVDSYNLNIL